MRKYLYIPVILLTLSIAKVDAKYEFLNIYIDKDKLELQEEIILKAFSVKKAPCVAITINSPGGSPVQSHLIYRFIREQAKKNNKERDRQLQRDIELRRERERARDRERERDYQREQRRRKPVEFQYGWRLSELSSGSITVANLNM